jgi:hypothetical protein
VKANSWPLRFKAFGGEAQEWPSDEMDAGTGTPQLSMVGLDPTTQFFGSINSGFFISDFAISLDDRANPTFWESYSISLSFDRAVVETWILHRIFCID